MPEAGNVYSSPSPFTVASVPENEMVEPAYGEPVAETSPEINVEEAYTFNCLLKSTDSDVVFTYVVEAVVEPILMYPTTANVPSAGFFTAHSPNAALANVRIWLNVIAFASVFPIGVTHA